MTIIDNREFIRDPNSKALIPINNGVEKVEQEHHNNIISKLDRLEKSVHSLNEQQKNIMRFIFNIRLEIEALKAERKNGEKR